NAATLTALQQGRIDVIMSTINGLRYQASQPAPARPQGRPACGPRRPRRPPPRRAAGPHRALPPSNRALPVQRARRPALAAIRGTTHFRSEHPLHHPVFVGCGRREGWGQGLMADASGGGRR
ncbi:hypothetical protein ACWEP7_36090, partial [Streptomyces sp. NPDC004135]